MRPFEELLEESARVHGHLCPGQVLGVRMAALGCKLVQVEEPTKSRDLLVYVEIDRCATDAIQAVTGCKLGNRTLKYFNYGKLAATFVNTRSNEAVRIAARNSSRESAWTYVQPGLDKKAAQVQAYQLMPNEELFTLMPVQVNILATDLPGHPLARTTCDACGEEVNDAREVVLPGRTLCRGCADGNYYRVLNSSLKGAQL